MQVILRPGSGHAQRLDCLEAGDEQSLRLRRGKGDDIEHIAGDAARQAEEFLRLGGGKTGKLGRFEKGGHCVGLLDAILQFARCMRWQAETQMHGGFQPLFHGLVTAADHGFERRDHVADHIFRRIVQKRHLHLVRRGTRAHAAENGLDDEAMLGDGKGVVAARLAVPAGDAGKAMSNVGNFHIERGRVEQVEPSSR